MQRASRASDRRTQRSVRRELPDVPARWEGCHSHRFGGGYRCRDRSAAGHRGTVLMTSAAAPHLIQRGGSVINMTSAVALVGDLGHPAYSASKVAIISLTRST